MTGELRMTPERQARIRALADAAVPGKNPIIGMGVKEVVAMLDVIEAARYFASDPDSLEAALATWDALGGDA